MYIKVESYIQYDELWKSDGTDAGTVLLKRFDERGATTGISITTDQYESSKPLPQW
jgi:ELWxxDGT repeat protein